MANLGTNLEAPVWHHHRRVSHDSSNRGRDRITVAPYRAPRNGSASARLVGHVAAIPNGNYYAGEKGFVISCLETVQTNPTFSQRIRFVLGRLSPDRKHLRTEAINEKSRLHFSNLR